MIYNLCRKATKIIFANNYKAKLNLFIESTSTDAKTFGKQHFMLQTSSAKKTEELIFLLF